MVTKGAQGRGGGGEGGVPVPLAVIEYRNNRQIVWQVSGHHQQCDTWNLCYFLLPPKLSDF